MESDIKRIYFNTSPYNKHNHNNNHTEPTIKKELVKRQATTSKKWIFENLNDEFQLNILHEIQANYNRIVFETNTEEKEKEKEKEKESIPFILQQITQKIHGYRSQDQDKKILNTEKFVDLPFVIYKLSQCELCCFYCREPTMLVYEYAREPRQWTLERIDNTFGHNKDNIEIACLTCNLRRRTMYHERYRFTKQMSITKMNSEEEKEKMFLEDIEETEKTT